MIELFYFCSLHFSFADTIVVFNLFQAKKSFLNYSQNRSEKTNTTPEKYPGKVSTALLLRKEKTRKLFLFEKK